MLLYQLTKVYECFSSQLSDCLFLFRFYKKPRNVASIDLVDDLSEGNEVMPHIVKVSEISHEKVHFYF